MEPAFGKWIMPNVGKQPHYFLDGSPMCGAGVNPDEDRPIPKDEMNRTPAKGCYCRDCLSKVWSKHAHEFH